MKSRSRSILLTTAATIICCFAGGAVEGTGCREFALVCNGTRDLDNCNVTRYRQYMGLAASAVLISAQMRMTKASLKAPWMNATGDCYIEAIVDSQGALLLIRFGRTRSLLTGAVDTPGWKKFRQTLDRYEAAPAGMQLVMDINGQQICPQLRRTDRRTGNFDNRILARFTQRTAVAYLPTESYVNAKFDLVSFESESAHLQAMQRQVAASYSLALADLQDQLKVSRKHPLTLWIYKCPTRLGVTNLPCNSEVNVYIFLRQWLNTTPLHAQKEDFFSTSDWRPKVIKQDIFLLVLVSLTSFYIVIHITCVTWIGLANASSLDEF